MNRRGFLGALAGGLFAPRIIRLPGLIMPISTLLNPHLMLRTYGYDNQGQRVLTGAVRIDDFDFEKGCTRRPVPVRKAMQIWNATVEAHGHSQLFDRVELSINLGLPRFLAQGDLLQLHDLKFEIRA